jgi:uncharacterized membrane protein
LRREAVALRERSRRSVKRHDPHRWKARAAILVAVILYALLPPKLTLGPWWVVPLVVVLLLVPLVAMAPSPQLASGRLTRGLSIALIAILNLVNVASVVLLVIDLLDTHAKNHGVSAAELLRYGGLIWGTNVIVFSLWYWELDSGGPFAREGCSSAKEFDAPDFLFPQMQLDPARVRINPQWKPDFIDYLYVSFTNALAVSPTDTMPLSRWAKMLMLVESLISFVTVALILARSVNILS